MYVALKRFSNEKLRKNIKNEKNNIKPTGLNWLIIISVIISLIYNTVTYMRNSTANKSNVLSKAEYLLTSGLEI